MRGVFGKGSNSPQLCVSRGSPLARGRQRRAGLLGGATYSASSLEIRFPKYKTSAIRDTMGSQFRLAAAVTKPSLKEKAEGRGSQRKELSGAASPCHPEARCVSGKGGRCHRVPEDVWQISWVLLGLGTESGGRGRGDVPQAPSLDGVSIPVLAFPISVMGQRGLCQISRGRCWKLSLFSVPALLVLL